MERKSTVGRKSKKIKKLRTEKEEIEDLLEQTKAENKILQNSEKTVKTKLSHALAHHQQLVNALKECVRCNICGEMVVMPPASSCGHLSCWICVAKSALLDATRRCAECRVPYGELKVNSRIKNIVSHILEHCTPQDQIEYEERILADANEELILRRRGEEFRQTEPLIRLVGMATSRRQVPTDDQELIPVIELE